MPRRKTSILTAKASKRKHAKNLKVKNKVKKTLKKFQAFITSGKIEEAKTFLNQVYKELDKAAKKGILHKNTANRKKSRLASKLIKKA